jgi:hypothetical protein
LDLQHLADLVSPLTIRLETTQAIITTMMSLSQDLPNNGRYPLGSESWEAIYGDLKSLEIHMEGYMASARLLEKRIGGIGNAVSDSGRSGYQILEANYVLALAFHGDKFEKSNSVNAIKRRHAASHSR